MTNNADPDNYSYFGYGNGFDVQGNFHCQMVVGLLIEKDVLILGTGQTDGLDDIVITAEAEYS